MSTGSNGTEAIEIASFIDTDGRIQQLLDPITLSISKDPSYVRYSLVYVGDVNSKPKEVVGTTGMLSCAADPSSLTSNTVCGSLILNGYPVQFSEGFCCACSLDQMVGLGSHHRGELQCNLLSGLFGSGASVHCLRLGDIWYSLFRILTPTVESRITVSVNRNQSVYVSAQKPFESIFVNDTLNVTARLVGSFSWVRPATDWGLSAYAAAPNIPGSIVSTDVRSMEWSPSNPFMKGLLVPISQVDLSGKTCNKIGVSHAAFVNNQANRCTGFVGDCLSNQIEDLWLKSKADDLIPSKVCQPIGGSFVANDGYRLSCKLDDSSSDVPTQVLIEMNAQDIRFIENRSRGKIVDVATTSSIVALVQKTTTFVTIANMGELKSDFLVSIVDCYPDGLLFPLAGMRISLDNGCTAVLKIKTEDSRISGSNYTCTAILSDPDANWLDSHVFSFSITSVVTDRGTQAGGPDGTAETPVGAPGSLVDVCETSCTGFFSVLCFISHGCWTKLLKLVGTFGGIGIVGFVLTKAGAWSIFWRIARQFGGCCCRKSLKENPKSQGKEVSSSHEGFRHMSHVYPQYPIYPNPVYTPWGNYLIFPNIVYCPLYI